MFFSKKDEKRITWRIEIDGLTMDRKPQYTVHKARAPYGWDYVCSFTDYTEARLFVEKHLDFPVYFYKD
jgi:hypothetical protein